MNATNLLPLPLLLRPRPRLQQLLLLLPLRAPPTTRSTRLSSSSSSSLLHGRPLKPNSYSSSYSYSCRYSSHRQTLLGLPERARRATMSSSARSTARRRRGTGQAVGAVGWGPPVDDAATVTTPPAPSSFLRQRQFPSSSSSSPSSSSFSTSSSSPSSTSSPSAVGGDRHTSSSSGPLQRLSLIARHLHHRPLLEINTPFSAERNSAPQHQDDIPYIPLTRDPLSSSSSQPTAPSLQVSGGKEEEAEEEGTQKEKEKEKHESSGTMSSQPQHPTLLIPGPIEFDDAVLQSMSHYSESHVGPGFVATFGEVLTMLRQLFQTSSAASQPFVVSGSGTLGWDMVAANLAERGDEVLVLHTGYFADSFADCFETYGVKATQLKAAIGSRPSLEEVEAALREKQYKLVTVTHVDTSTGVLSDIRAVAELVRRVSPATLVVVDGVCSVGCEEIAFDDWGLDAVLTASQKAIGCPAGLCILMCSGRAVDAFEARKTPPASYFASFKNWMPIMKNYEAKKPSYFATPSPQLIHALHTALTQIVSSSSQQDQTTTTAAALGARFAAHTAASQRIKAHLTQTLGLRQLAADPACQAHGMTAVWLPEGLKPTDLLPKLMARGIVFAGGLHREVATKYVRFGHMGVSILDERRGDVDKALKGLGEALAECGYSNKDVEGEEKKKGEDAMSTAGGGEEAANANGKAQAGA